MHTTIIRILSLTLQILLILLELLKLYVRF
jgi:hypothetical protein